MTTFSATPFVINDHLVVLLPTEASSELPSRGQVMVKGTINGHKFQDALEPDGRGSHWLLVTDELQKSAGVAASEPVELQIEAIKDWPEPVIPTDVQQALSAPDIQKLWSNVTPMARWEWLRWIGSTANPDTRAKRIEVSLSKLRKGMHRPCCFNRSMCCNPSVSKNGQLLERMVTK